MFQLKTVLAVCAFAAAAHAATFSVTIQANENGVGNFANSTGFTSPLPASAENDLGPTGFNNALFFGMLNPPGLLDGDLLLMDGGVVSDVIRFNSTLSGGGFFFYSQAGGGQLADIGLPTSYLSLSLQIPEIEGGITSYTPLAGQPGFVSGAAGQVTYQFGESAVPEPATWLLIAPAVAALIARRRSRASASSSR